MKLIHIAVALAIMVVICTPIVLGSTNSHTETRTTTAELSNGAVYTGVTISNDQLAITGFGKYVSRPFTAVNLTSTSVLPYSANSTDCIYDYGFLYSNTLWLNSSDARHNTGGHAHYGIRYPFTSNDGGYIRDFWHTYDLVGSSQDAILGSGTIVSPTSKPYQNYIVFDGVDDYTRTNFAYNYHEGWWYTAFMFKADGTTGAILGISDGYSNGYIMLQYVDAAPDYLELVVRDKNANQASCMATGITPNTWHFCVLRADATRLYLYVDGTLYGSVDLTYYSSSRLDFNYIQLGALYYGGNNVIHWAGQMDEFRWHAGALPTSECSNTGLMGTYMWACVNGDTPTKPSSYKVAGAGDGNLYTVITAYTTGDVYFQEYSWTWLNTKPSIVAVWPRDNILYDTGATVVLAVNVTDADITYEDYLHAAFYVDGEYVGASSRTTNGELQVNIHTFTGGYHEWYAVVTDSWGGSTTTDTEGFYVYSTLYVRDEQDYDNLITGANITVNFYTENFSATIESVDGTIDLTGLPTQNLLVTASAEGYHHRKTIITNLFNEQTIYLIDGSANVIYNTFELNRQSLEYKPSEYILRINKPMNGSVDTVFCSYFDFDAKCGAYLIADDVYQLVIEDPEGTQINYGWVYPDPDGTIVITLTEMEYTEFYNGWLKYNFTVDRTVDSVTFNYESTEDVILASMVVTADGEELYNATSTNDDDIFNYVSTENAITTTITVQTAVETFTAVHYTVFQEDLLKIYPDSYPQWLRLIITVVMSISLMLGFGSWRSDVAAALGVGWFSFCAYHDAIDVNPLSISIMIIAALGAIMKHNRRQKRVF
jgi:hypothetical protein